MRWRSIAFGAWPSKLTTKKAISLSLFFVVVLVVVVVFFFLVRRNILFDLGVRIFVKKKHFVLCKSCPQIRKFLYPHLFFFSQ